MLEGLLPAHRRPTTTGQQPKTISEPRGDLSTVRTRTAPRPARSPTGSHRAAADLNHVGAIESESWNWNDGSGTLDESWTASNWRSSRVGKVIECRDAK